MKRNCLHLDSSPTAIPSACVFACFGLYLRVPAFFTSPACSVWLPGRASAAFQSRAFSYSVPALKVPVPSRTIPGGSPSYWAGSPWVTLPFSIAFPLFLCVKRARGRFLLYLGRASAPPPSPVQRCPGSQRRGCISWEPTFGSGRRRPAGVLTAHAGGAAPYRGSTSDACAAG